MYFKEGQTECHECGKSFVPDRIPTEAKPEVACTCPDGCRGSWCSLRESGEYCVPVEVQAIRENGKITIWAGTDQGRFGDCPGRTWMNTGNIALFS